MLFVSIALILVVLHVMTLVLAASALIRHIPNTFHIPWLVVAIKAFNIVVFIKVVIWLGLLYVAAGNRPFNPTYYDAVWLITEYLGSISILIMQLSMRIFVDWIQQDPETKHYMVCPRRRKTDYEYKE